MSRLTSLGESDSNLKYPIRFLARLDLRPLSRLDGEKRCAMDLVVVPIVRNVTPVSQMFQRASVWLSSFHSQSRLVGDFPMGQVESL